MEAAPRETNGRVIVAPQRRRRLRALFEWWWNLDRRRHITRLGEEDRRRSLDEGYVVAAMARQLEEIRNLPEAAV
jgi:hypothetical protein